MKQPFFLVMLYAFLSAGLLVAFILFFWRSAKQQKIISPLSIPLQAKPTPKPTLWQIRSIDTMKESRDLAREMLRDTTSEASITQQLGAIKKTGANFVAIDTPYDDEFYPVLSLWVREAHREKLRVWFRGNFSGWEGWFGYNKITPLEHLQKTLTFITTHPDLFADGDIFTSCPECENGGSGDPRQTHDSTGYRQFLISHYQKEQQAFRLVNKKVQVGFFSMNYDVALLIMDKKTTNALGGTVVIDHYVKTPEKLTADILALRKKSGGKIILGEFGVPVPDIHGSMNDEEQAAWISQLLKLLKKDASVIGVNYWVNMRGTTAIWDTTGTPKKAVGILQTYFSHAL